IFMKKILLSFLLLFLAASIGSGIWLFSGSADLEESRFTSPTASLSLYDKNGDLLTQAYPSTGRIASKLSEIAPQTVQAFLSIEDKGFYSHGGIEPKRMLKAVWKNLSSLSFREGASTITQQLIKNTHLSNEKTLSRKLKEVRLALALERKHSKDEILEFYLNTVYYGHDLFGIGDAASYFFDKSPSDLTLAESAMLAGLLQSPNRYSPFINPDRCLARRSVVLAAMEKDGAINSEERTKAEEEPLPTKAHGKRDSLSFVLSELDRFTEEKGLSRLRDGNVYTSIDPALQKKLEAIPHETDLTIAVSDNQTHKIIGYYSSVGEIRRLPGSIIKPLLVYAPCMEEGLVQPATPILDEKTDFGGYSPSNYNDAYHGYVSARQALARSLNVPAVKLLSSLGVEKGKAYLSKMGLTTKEDSLTLALGGMQDGFTLTQLVNAYSVFTSGGYYCPSSPLVSFTLGKKEVLCQTEYEKNRVFSEETVSLMNNILQDTVKIGTAKKLQFSTFTPMAKTGTVGSETGNTDAWTIVYTADHTVGVWLGNADYSLHTETGGDKACRIAREVLSVLTAEHTPSSLPVADG
ncbi:MAG: transglycosylase domain-containing protein, partial [Christensenellaceae bacterium]